MHMKRVVISTDDCPTYFFFAPFTALLWRTVAGYEPTVMAVRADGSYNWGPLQAQYEWVLESCRSLGVQVVPVEPIPGRLLTTVAQVSRMFVAPLYPDTDYILTSDMDMWPLSHGWFNQQDPGKELQLFYSNAYDQQKYPMCYIGGSAKVWRDIMDILHTNDINAAIRKALDDNLRPDASSDESWNFDERLFMSKLSKWSGYKGCCQFIERGVKSKPMARIDRSSWAWNHATTYIDSHLVRPGWTAENWPKLKPLLEHAMAANPSGLQSLLNFKAEWDARTTGQ